MDILEKARELGTLIKQSEAMKRCDAAEAAYDADEELRALVDEYNAQDSALATNDDPEFVSAIQERMTKIYNSVMANPVYLEYIQAQQEVAKLMQEVNDEINFAVTGQRSCSHDCSSCGGSCH